MSDSPQMPDALAEARQQFEAEKLTRRAALKKFGITSGMAVFGMFAADDLARMVLQKMEEHKETRQIAEAVAQEFKNSGIAFAGTAPAGCDPGLCNSAAIGQSCYNGNKDDLVACGKCVTRSCHVCACGNPSGVPCKDAGCNSYCYSTAIGYCSYAS